MKKIVSLLIFSLTLTSAAYATSFTLTGDSTAPSPGIDAFSNVGDYTFAFSSDPTTQRLSGTLNYAPNASGSVADFFFVALTEGPFVTAGNAATLVFDASTPGAIQVSAYQYADFNGANQPLIEAFSGDLLFTTVLTGTDPNVISASQSSTPSGTTYNFELDTSLFPDSTLDFSNGAGIWLQSAGLNDLFGTFINYGTDGRISEIVASIASPGGYAFYDGESIATVDTATLPEPASMLLLGSALGLFGIRRRKD